MTFNHKEYCKKLYSKIKKLESKSRSDEKKIQRLEKSLLFAHSSRRQINKWAKQHFEGIITDLKNENKMLKEKYMKTRHLYVYFITDGNYVKIGRSKNPKKRLKTIKQYNPSAELLFAFKCSEKIENYLHRYYEDKREHGEWFTLNEEIVSPLLEET